MARTVRVVYEFDARYRSTWYADPSVEPSRIPGWRHRRIGPPTSGPAHEVRSTTQFDHLYTTASYTPRDYKNP